MSLSTIRLTVHFPTNQNTVCGSFIQNIRISYLNIYYIYLFIPPVDFYLNSLEFTTHRHFIRKGLFFA